MSLRAVLEVSDWICQPLRLPDNPGRASVPTEVPDQSSPPTDGGRIQVKSAQNSCLFSYLASSFKIKFCECEQSSAAQHQFVMFTMSTNKMLLQHMFFLLFYRSCIWVSAPSINCRIRLKALRFRSMRHH